MRLYILLAAFLSYTALAGIAWGDTDEQTSYYIYNMDQNIKGDGFFSSYQDLATNELVINNLDHGSGSYNGESDYFLGYDVNRVLSDLGQLSITGGESISFNKSTDFAYAAKRFDLGKSFHAAIQSKGQEQTCLKNYDGSHKTNLGGISMNSLFNQLDVLSSTTSAALFFKNQSSDDGDQISLNTSGFIRLNLDSSFTGKGHIGVLDLSNDADDPNVIDEDFLGTFSLSKKMSAKLSNNWVARVDHWLPCCYGGYNDLMPGDKKSLGSSTKGVFDCTCFSPAGQA